jgi:hypothetical protein
MKREELEHVLRAASAILGEPDILVIGSASILGSITEDRLPGEATMSSEADIAFFDDPDDSKADLIDGAIGELSLFNDTFGYYAQGVSVSTAVLPEGWRDRVVVLDTPNTAPGRGHCLEPHDCVVSKLVAGREKDYAFAAALIREHLIDPDVLTARIEQLRGVEARVMNRLRKWVDARRDGIGSGFS